MALKRLQVVGKRLAKAIDVGCALTAVRGIIRSSWWCFVVRWFMT